MRRSAIGILVLVVLTLVGRSTAQDYAFTLKGADVAFAERDYAVARQLYERAIREGASLEQDLPHARNLSTTYLNANPPETAKSIQWLQVVVRLDPQADGLRLQLCRMLLNTGDTGGAVLHYRQLLERHPQSSDYVLALASALRQDGKSDAALRLLKETVERYPNMNSVRLEYARALNFQREFSEARRQFSKVLDYDPNDLIAQVGMAKSMSYDGDQEGALVEYERILRSHPGLYDAMIGKAFALLWSGRMEEARELLQKGLSRHPDDREVRDALNSLPRGNSVVQSALPAAAPAPVTPTEMHRSNSANLVMEPRTITPPKAEHSRKAQTGNSKTHPIPDAPSAAPQTDVGPAPLTQEAPPVGILYIVLVAAIALLAFAGVKLRSMQQAYDAEMAAAKESAPRMDYVSAAMGLNSLAPANPAHNRRLSDMFVSPIARRETDTQTARPSVSRAVPKPEEPIVRVAAKPLTAAARVQETSVPAAEKVLQELPVISASTPPAPVTSTVIPIAAVFAPEPKQVPAEPEVEGDQPLMLEDVPVLTSSIATAEFTPTVDLVKAAPIAMPEPPRTSPITQAETSRATAIPMTSTEVLIVGGLASVVQLQLRWLNSQIADVKPVLEREWAVAASRLSTMPPAIVILNSGSDDRWTSMRMYDWIAANYPELRRRVIAVTTADHCAADSDDLVLCEPIDVREWQQKVATALSESRSQVNLASMHGATQFDMPMRRVSAQ